MLLGLFTDWEVCEPDDLSVDDVLAEAVVVFGDWLFDDEVVLQLSAFIEVVVFGVAEVVFFVVFFSIINSFLVCCRFVASE